MRNYIKGTRNRLAKILPALLVVSLFLVSCDKYIYDDKEPDWLGASIYDYLKTDGNYKNYTRLIEDLGYTEVLSKTGSKTLFVANDSAFTEFYKSNQWGVTGYEKFTPAQKKLILNFSMINNAYLINMLSNYNNGGLKEGAAMRRETAISVLDSLPFNAGGILPASAYWLSGCEAGSAHHRIARAGDRGEPARATGKFRAAVACAGPEEGAIGQRNN